MRLEYELKNSYSAHFVTLTYSDPPLGDFALPTLVKKDVQDFMKRLRKRIRDPIKYYLCGEYGENTCRPHYHVIFFNLPQEPLKVLFDSWQHGLIHIGEVTPRSIRYTLKYIMQGKKNSSLHEYVQRPFALMSKGLGVGYVISRKKWHRDDITRNYVVQEGGKKTRLPRYFRDKLYSKTDKQKQRVIYEQKQAQNSVRESSRFFKDQIEQKVDFTEKLDRTLKRNSKL